jgi:hypothetical protein
LLQCLLATAGERDLEPVLAEEDAESFAGALLVVDDQDARAR